MSFLINNFVELTVTGLVLGAVYGLVALGYTLVYGVLQLINFAHSEVWMFGSFAAVWVDRRPSASPRAARWPVVIGVLLLALLAAMAVSGGVALLLERVAYRRLIRLDAPKLVALISAIGASFALAEFMGLRDRIADFFGLRDTLDPYVRSARDNTRFQNPLETEGVFTVGGYTVSNVDIIIIVSAILMMVALDQFIRRTRTGRGIRAVAQDSEAAALMGVNSNRVILATFLVGGIMAGAAGAAVPDALRRHPLQRRLPARRQGVHRRRPRRHRQRPRRAARRLRPRPGRELRLGLFGSRVDATSSPSCCWSSSCCSGPPACSARPWGGPAHERTAHPAPQGSTAAGCRPRPSARPTTRAQPLGWDRGALARRVTALPRPAKWALIGLLVVFLYALPLLEIPILSTPGHATSARAVHRGQLRARRPGAQHRARLRRPARPRLRRLLRRRRLHGRGASAPSTAQLSWWLLIPLAVVLTTISGILLGAPTLRVRGDYLAIVTLGFGEIIRLTALNLEWLGAAQGHHRACRARRASSCSRSRTWSGRARRRSSTSTTRRRSCSSAWPTRRRTTG